MNGFSVPWNNACVPQRRRELYAYGEGQARKLGIKEEDVDRIIHQFRQEEREGKHPENDF